MVFKRDNFFNPSRKLGIEHFRTFDNLLTIFLDALYIFQLLSARDVALMIEGLKIE